MNALAVESGILTACLSCGWVHAFPWRCQNVSDLAVIPATGRQNDIRVFRVGKANTLLLTPNDWSTLSNRKSTGKAFGPYRVATGITSLHALSFI
jgi:hypothetical protein